jgi:nucleotide-binding universal stress UspA family protein
VAQIGRTGSANYMVVRVVQPVVASVHPYTFNGAPAWQTEDPAATKEAVSHARNYLNATAGWLKARCATVDVEVRVDERVAGAIVNTAREHEADLVALTTHARRGCGW